MARAETPHDPKNPEKTRKITNSPRKPSAHSAGAACGIHGSPQPLSTITRGTAQLYPHGYPQASKPRQPPRDARKRGLGASDPTTPTARRRASPYVPSATKCAHHSTREHVRRMSPEAHVSRETPSPASPRRLTPDLSASSRGSGHREGKRIPTHSRNARERAHGLETRPRDHRPTSPADRNPSRDPSYTPLRGRKIYHGINSFPRQAMPGERLETQPERGSGSVQSEDAGYRRPRRSPRPPSPRRRSRHRVDNQLTYPSEGEGDVCEGDTVRRPRGPGSGAGEEKPAISRIGARGSA